MSAHVKVWRNALYQPRGFLRDALHGRQWMWLCRDWDCSIHGTHPTHAEALAAAWAHIKEHS